MLIIGITGGSGSGKTTVVQKIVASLPKDAVTVISQDSYYWDNGHLDQEEKKKINFDHPSAIEFNLLNQHIKMLKNGQTIERPIYSYVNCSRAKETTSIKPGKVIIVEGILIFTNKKLRDQLDVKVFVDADSDDRLTRIILRDIQERGRSYLDVLNHYNKFVKKMHLQFIEPTKRYADIIVPQGGENLIAIDLLTSRIQRKLRDNQ